VETEVLCGVLRISAQMDSSSETDVEHHLVTNDRMRELDNPD